MLSQIRLAWLLLALVTAVVYGGTWTARWLGLLGVPWAAGAFLLALRGRRISGVARTLFASRIVVTLQLILTGIVLLVVYLFKLEGALAVLILSWGGWLVVASFLSAGRAVELTIGASLAAVSVGVVLGVAEISLRLLAVAVPGGTEERIEWRSRYDRLWERNVFGFRSPYEVPTKDSLAFRVLALGDSFTWGEQIALTEDLWPGRLEKRLAEEHPNRPVEVWNLAKNGYTTANEAELLRRLGWNFDPDLVIVQFYINDALPSQPDFRHESSAWLFPQHRLLPLRLRDGRVRLTRLYRLLQKGYNEFRNAEISWKQLYVRESETWQQLEAAVRDLGAQAGERDVPMIFLLFPAFEPGEWTVESYPYRDEYTRVADVARDVGLHALDMTPVFADSAGDWTRWWVSDFDAHPTPTAHAMAAEQLTRLIQREGMIPR